jgi:haloalkane dehalogenase
MNNKPRVLLTASYGPNDPGWGEDMFDIVASRLGRGHGPFQTTSHCHYFGLYLIAENITNPTTVLENPHWDEFDQELDEGYDVVGFQLKSLHTPKVARMIRRIREKRPDTRIVVGGYGVNALRHELPGDRNGDGAYVRENADHLCREEGVRFMRRILGDEPLDREITQYQLPMAGFSPAGLKTPVRGPMILVSLGCPNACDFCNTSATFDHKKIYVAEPGQVVRFAKNYQKRLRVRNIMVSLYDEDFFLNQEYVRELGRLLRKDRETWGIKYFSFGSVRSLSQFDPLELRDCGCGAVWVGVESFLCGHGLPEDNYGKRQGSEIKQMIAGLQKHGIDITASMVLGFDFHDRENLKQDIDQFVALKPSAYQISPLLPCPGTALYERMLEEDRIYDTYKWEDFHLWCGEQFELKNFEKGEMKNFHDYAIEQLSNINGPPVLQAMEIALDSRKLLAGMADDYHSYGARRAMGLADAVYSYLRPVKTLHHSEKVRERARELEKRYHTEIGDPPLFSKAVSYYLANRIKKKSRTERPPVVSDPPVRWSYYHTFDDRVWVRKGREAKKPVPYKDPHPIAGSLARRLRGRS